MSNTNTMYDHEIQTVAFEQIKAQTLARDRSTPIPPNGFFNHENYTHTPVPVLGVQSPSGRFSLAFVCSRSRSDSPLFPTQKDYFFYDVEEIWAVSKKGKNGNPTKTDTKENRTR